MKKKIKISPVGMLNKSGFTLIELTVVVFLIGLMLLVAVPRVRDTVLTDDLKRTAIYLTNAARNLRNDAIRNNLDYILHLDMDDHIIWTDREDMTPEMRDEAKRRAFHISDGIAIADIYYFGGKKVTDGDITVRFLKKGYVQPTVVHLSQEERHFTLIFSPFMTTVRIYDRYIDYRYSA